MHKISELYKNAFLRSSFVVLSGSVVINAFNYAFNLVTGRMLTPAEYGEVVSLVTLAMITSVPSSTLTSIMAKYTADYKEKKQLASINFTFRLATLYSLIFGIALIILAWMLLPFLGGFLKIEALPLLIFSLSFPASLLSASGRGVLQGLREFNSYTTSGIIETGLKLALAAALVLAGLSVEGVMLALVLGILSSYFFCLGRLKAALPSPAKPKTPLLNPKSLFKNFPSSSKTIFLTTLLLSVFANVDVILAKHYLPPDEAGLYSALAVIGRIMTYGSFAVVTVMFPMISSASAYSDRNHKLIIASLGLVLLISLVILSMFFTVPEFIVLSLLGSKYLSIAVYLKSFGMAMMLAALAKVFIYFFMAIQKNAFLFPFFIITALQIGIIILFHQNISQITNNLIVTSGLLLACLIAIYLSSFVIFRTKSVKANPAL